MKCITLKSKIFLILPLCFACHLGSFTAQAAHYIPAGKKALQQIEELKGHLHKKIDRIDQRIQRSLKTGHAETVSDLESLKKLRGEYFLRLDLFDRLQLGIETHFKSGELKEFLVGYLLILSEIEIKNNPTQDSHLWKIAIYLSQALNKIPERFEDPIEFIAAYVDFSSLSYPQSPQEFIAQRNYTNGRDYSSANPVSVIDLKRRPYPNASPSASQKYIPQIQVKTSSEVSE